jgi:hypothetical protein
VITITIMDGQERLSKPLWLLGVNIFPFAWVVMYGAALGVYEWDCWWNGQVKDEIGKNRESEHKMGVNNEPWSEYLLPCI